MERDPDLPDIYRAAWLAVLLATAVGWDLRSRRIPNWLTAPAVLAAIAANGIAGGWPGLQLALVGFAAGGVAWLVALMTGGLGGGDVKLVFAIGALMGPAFTLRALICAALAGALLALVAMARRGHFLTQLRVFGRHLLSAALVGSTEPVVAGAPDQKLPYSLAIAAGCLAAWISLGGAPF